MQRRLRRTDYSVGWVCALPVELAAAQLMLDERHPDLERDPTDSQDNLYVLGSINGHNVAIGCLPAGQTGNNSAAVVATQMLATFKKIRFGLMVGIGGGVPSAHADVRLGDVVVSQPHGTFGGVVQYDMGKTTIEGFRRTGSLNSPPQTLLNAVQRIQANEWLGKSGLPEHAVRLERSKFQRSRAGPDVLFDSAYDHQGPRSQTCVMCSADRIEVREPRTDGEEVVVHYGTIASGNRVMKNARERDTACAQLGGVLCFEMEAAGLMNNFPCLVIRGICDYSDTHKNDRWQAYAAGTAAAYAREVLSVIRPIEVVDTQTADYDIRQYSGTVLASRREEHDTRRPEDGSRADPVAIDHIANARGPLHANRNKHSKEMDQSSSHGRAPERNEMSTEQREMIKASLHFKQRDARLLTLKQAQAKTCQWLLENTKYTDWMHAEKIAQHRGFFWIKGKPGSGKSIMMKFLFSHAKRSMRKTHVLSFFFNARGETLEKTTTGLYRALVLQLLEKAPQTWEALEDDDNFDATLNLVEQSGWPDEVLRQLFIRCLQKLTDRRVVCYVDALDECPEDDIRTMVSFFEEIGETESTAEFRVCFSSRHYPEISIRTGLQLVLEAEAEHTDDITLYIDANLKIGNTPQFEDVRAEILRKASGIFLWVHLVIPMLNREYDTGRIKALKKRLAQIPAGLHDLFADMLTRDKRRLRVFLVSVEIILCAARPLKPDEFRIAVESYCEEGYNHDQRHDSESMSAENLRRFVLDASKGLAEITKSKEPNVQWIHESVRDFFLKENGLSKLRSAENSLQESGHSVLVKLCLQQLDNQLCWSGVGFPKAPFLRYAVDHILYHANDAQKSNADHESFLQKFDKNYKPIWSSLYLGYRLRGLGDIHLLYYLGEFGADELIRIHPDRDKHFELRGGTYDLPLTAALFAGHNAAARALLGLPRAPEVRNAAMTVSRAPPILTLKKDQYRVSRHVLTYLCQYGDPVLLKRALSTKASGSVGVPPRELFRYAASEAIVDLLASFYPIGSALIVVTTNPWDLEVYRDPGDSGFYSTKMPYLSLLLQKNPHLCHAPFLWRDEKHILVYAAARGFNEIAKLCIENTDITTRRQALSAALRGNINQEGRILILKQLLETGPLSVQDQTDLEQALFDNVRLPYNEGVAKLILTKTKINLEATNNEGMTALLWAIYQGRKAYVQMFLDAGSDPMARMRRDGATALMLAIKLGDLTSFRLLLNHPRCRPNARDKYGRTALSWCAMIADDCADTMITELLHRADIRPNSADKSGRTTLMRAVESANLPIVQTLCLAKGIDPDSGPCHRSTPLRLSIMRYVETGHKVFLDIARTLLVYKADFYCPRKLPTPAALIARHDDGIYASLEAYEKRVRTASQGQRFSLLYQIRKRAVRSWQVY